MSANVRLLNLRMERAVSELLATGSPTRAAVAAGVSARTVRRWSASQPFRDEYRSRARKLADDAVVDLQAASAQAVATLRNSMTNGTAATRTRAAACVLQMVAKLADDDLSDRLAELERRAERWTDDEISRIGWTG